MELLVPVTASAEYVDAMFLTDFRFGCYMGFEIDDNRTSLSLPAACAGFTFTDYECYRELMAQDFDWKRFWCPRDKGFHLSDRGFLSDPEGKWDKYSNPDLVTFERVAELPCAVMLGEPGIGKSWTLRHESAGVERSLTTGAKSMSSVKTSKNRAYGAARRDRTDLVCSSGLRSQKNSDCWSGVFLTLACFIELIRVAITNPLGEARILITFPARFRRRKGTSS